MAELSQWLLILLLTSQGISAADSADTTDKTPTAQGVSMPTTSLNLSGNASSAVDTTSTVAESFSVTSPGQPLNDANTSPNSTPTNQQSVGSEANGITHSSDRPSLQAQDDISSVSQDDGSATVITPSSTVTSIIFTSIESTSHASVEFTSTRPALQTASDRQTISTPRPWSTSDIQSSVLKSETTVANRDVANTKLYLSLLHKYHVMKSAFVGVGVASGVIIVFLLVIISVLCCTRRTVRRAAEPQSIPTDSTFNGGSQVYNWYPALPRPSIRPSVYREVSVEMRENLQRRQKSQNEQQNQEPNSTYKENNQAPHGKVNEGFTPDASPVDFKQPTVGREGGHKSPPVTFGPVSVVTISSTTPTAAQPNMSYSTPPFSEAKTLTVPRPPMATTTNVPAESPSHQQVSTQLDASNGGAGRGQPQKKRRDLAYF